MKDPFVTVGAPKDPFITLDVTKGSFIAGVRPREFEPADRPTPPAGFHVRAPNSVLSRLPYDCATLSADR